MNCNDVDKNITAFLEDTLSPQDTAAFIQHIENCKTCYDECEVRFMVKYTSVALEQDDSISYDLTRLLPRKIAERKKWLKKKKKTKILLTIVGILLLLAAVAFVVLRENPRLIEYMIRLLRIGFSYARRVFTFN